MYIYKKCTEYHQLRFCVTMQSSDCTVIAVICSNLHAPDYLVFKYKLAFRGDRITKMRSFSFTTLQSWKNKLRDCDYCANFSVILHYCTRFSRYIKHDLWYIKRYNHRYHIPVSVRCLLMPTAVGYFHIYEQCA